jgi:hypothetical protein
MMAAFLSCFAAGCTQVAVRDSVGVRVHYYPGVAVVEVNADPRTGTSVGIEGGGLVIGTSSITLGWHSEQVIALPDPNACQAVFVIRSEEELEGAFEALRAGTPNSEGICAEY